MLSVQKFNLIVGLILLSSVAISIIIYIRQRRKREVPKEHFSITTDFKIFNHLQNRPIKIKVSLPTISGRKLVRKSSFTTRPLTNAEGSMEPEAVGNDDRFMERDIIFEKNRGRFQTPVEIKMEEPVTIIENIKPMESEGLTKDQVEKYLVNGAVIKILLADTDEHFADYFLNLPSCKTIKQLRVGMVTSRYIGNASNKSNLTVTAANANRGQAFITIHNLTSVKMI